MRPSFRVIFACTVLLAGLSPASDAYTVKRYPPWYMPRTADEYYDSLYQPNYYPVGDYGYMYYNYYNNTGPHKQFGEESHAPAPRSLVRQRPPQGQAPAVPDQPRALSYPKDEMLKSYRIAMDSYARHLYAVPDYMRNPATSEDMQPAPAPIPSATRPLAVRPPVQAVAPSPTPRRASFAETLGQAGSAFRTKDYAKALPLYQSAVKFQPQNPIAQMGLSLAYLAREDNAAASQALRQALALYPKWYRQPPTANTFFENPADLASIVELLASKAQASPNGDLRFLLAYLQWMQGDASPAQKTLRDLLAQQPKHIEAARLLGAIATAKP